ncbi:hypothetical protein [Sorangium sp. So ce1024]
MSVPMDIGNVTWLSRDEEGLHVNTVVPSPGRVEPVSRRSRS